MHACVCIMGAAVGAAATHRFSLWLTGSRLLHTLLQAHLRPGKGRCRGAVRSGGLVGGGMQDASPAPSYWFLHIHVHLQA